MPLVKKPGPSSQNARKGPPAITSASQRSSAHEPAPARDCPGPNHTLTPADPRLTLLTATRSSWLSDPRGVCAAAQQFVSHVDLLPPDHPLAFLHRLGRLPLRQAPRTAHGPGRRIACRHRCPAGLDPHPLPRNFTQGDHRPTGSYPPRHQRADPLAGPRPHPDQRTAAHQRACQGHRLP